MENKSYICIDLKSFYASAECAERGLDPFCTNLVVADPERSKSTICLAITPAMKQAGVKNRCRIHEIPPDIPYIVAKPRMHLYLEYSAKIYGIYLRYIAPEDIHVYSVDECFLDVTDYLKLYHMTAEEMAAALMGAVKKETRITATAGIGSNLYLAKIAMDIIAKHTKQCIGTLTESSYRKMLWSHKPLSDFWQIGRKTERKLAQYGMYTMGDIAKMSLSSEDWLYRLFGIDAELLIDHAWGVEPCRMQDIKNYQPTDHSLSNGQVLMRNYAFEEALVVVKEMSDMLSLDLMDKGLVTDSITLRISYDHRFGISDTGGTVNLKKQSNNSGLIIQNVEQLYRATTDIYTGIRRINITANRVYPESCLQYDLFTDPVKAEKEQDIQQMVLAIKKRFGKNAILRGVNLLPCATTITRNQQIGGHHA